MTTYLWSLVLLASLSAPHLDIYRSRSIPWVGEVCSYTLALQGAQPGSGWKLTLDVRGSDGILVLVDAEVTADDQGQATATARHVFRRAGWYQVQAHAASRDKNLRASVQTPVTQYRVDFAWYQAQEGYELRWPTIQLTCREQDEQYWKQRGVFTAHWCGAMCGRDKPMEHFVRGWTSKPAIAIDEFGGPAEDFPKFRQALIEARKLRPDEFIAAWFCGWYDFWPELKGLLDFFLPEIYLNYSGYNLTRFDWIVEHARKCGTFYKTLVGLGINVVKHDDGTVRYRPTPEEIVEQVRYLKQIAPDLRGLAFFTYGSAEPAVRAAVDQACRDYFLGPVADLVEATVRPELARPGQEAIVTATVRNAGAMPGRGFTVHCRQGDQAVDATCDLQAGEAKRLRLTLRPMSGPGEISVGLTAPAGAPVLRARRSLPVARVEGREDVLCAPALPVGAPPGPLWLTDRHPAAICPLDSSGLRVQPEPTDTFALPDGSRLTCWRSPATGPGETRLWRLLDVPIPAAPERAVVIEHANGGCLRVMATGYQCELRPAEDAIAALQPAGAPVEILASPWRMVWDAWRGFGDPAVQRGASAACVTVPVDNDQITGWTCYLFYPDALEVRRSFKSKGEEVLVTAAGEHARVEQREGTYAAQHGVGARPSRGRLQVTTEYRDLYFGSPGLGPEAAKRGGWFDFSWTAATPAGLGVVVAEQWETRASTAGYDVTRYYDAADWIEVAQVWGGKQTPLRQGKSRIFLVPHGYLDLSNDTTTPPAQALWERLHAPVRCLKR